MSEPNIEVTVSPAGSVHLLGWAKPDSVPSRPPDLDIGMSVRMAQNLSNLLREACGVARQQQDH